jgi:hypothetical protein
MIKQIPILVGFILMSCYSFSATVYDTLHINKSPYLIGGAFGYTFQACVFNASSSFDVQNEIIEINEGDNLQLHVINNDTLEHTFTIENLVESNNIIAPGGTNDFTLNFNNIGPYRFYSDVFYGRHLGASSIIMYGYEDHARYYWNMFEQSDTLSEEIALLDATSIPFDYQPDIFSINMKVHPDIQNDPNANIVQNVGDTIYISIVNSGAMLHTLHFHGYHVEIISASINSRYNGWIKDSFSVLQDEVILVRLVPDKAGFYPVHEHNLINITTNGSYPGGMLNLLEIQP